MKNRKKVCIIQKGGPNWIGGEEYSRNLLKAVYHASADTEDVQLALLNINGPGFYDVGSSFPGLEVLSFERPKRNTPAGLILKKMAKFFKARYDYELDSFLESRNVDFVYPYFSHRRSDARFRAADWIWDLQHKYYPEFFGKDEIAERDAMFSRLVKYSRHIVLSSNSVRSDLERFYGEPSGLVTVMPFRVIPENEWYVTGTDEVVKRYGLPERFFMVSNQFWRHKNHKIVFEAIKSMDKDMKDVFCVFTGGVAAGRDDEYLSEMKALMRESDVTGKCSILGLIPKQDQIQLMRASLAVIQPSLFEGWSTVVEETRALGKKVILSDIPVHREQSPPGAVFFDPSDPLGLAGIMADSWRQDSSGTDRDTEDKAGREAFKLAAEFSRKFIDIVYAQC